MPNFRTPGSIRVSSLRNSYLRSRALNTRGVNGENWLAIFWWEALDLHVLLLRLNGNVTAEEHYVISVTTGNNRRVRRTKEAEPE
jgi:hypothetical protein